MADKNRNIKFTITANAEQPKKSLEELNGILEKLEANRKKMIADGVAEGKMWDLNKTEIRDTKKQIKELEDNFETVSKVIADLANSSLPQLKKAFKEGQRAISKMSEDNVNLKPMQAALQEIQQQMDIITGKAKNVAKGIEDIDNKSDGWIASAKRQMKDYIASLDEVDEHYHEQVRILGVLEAKEKERADKFRANQQKLAKEQFDKDVLSANRMLADKDSMSKHNATEIQTAINTLKQAQQQAMVGGELWQKYGEKIKAAEKNFAELTGKMKQETASMSGADATKILGNVSGNTEVKVREAINALKLLRSETNVGGEDWKNYTATIEQAENELAKLMGKVQEVKKAMTQDEAKNVLDNMTNFNEGKIREAIDVFKNLRHEAKVGGSDWQTYNKQVEDAEQQLGKLTGKVKEAEKAMSKTDAKNIIGNMSDNTEPKIREAIKALYALRDETKAGGAEWKTYTEDIEKAEAELATLTGKAREAKKELSYDDAKARIGDANASTAQLREARSTIAQHRDSLALSDVTGIETDDKLLKQIEDRLESVADKAKKAKLSADQLKDIIDNTDKHSYEEVDKALSQMTDELKKLKVGSPEAKKLTENMQKLRDATKGVEKELVDVNDIIRRSKTGKASITELKQAYKQLEEELNKIKDLNGSAFKNGQKDLKALKKQIDEVTGAAQKQGGAWKTALRNLTAYVGLFEVFKKVQALFTDFFRLNQEFSDQLVNIRKVSNLAMTDVEHMANNLAKIDTRTTIQELNQIAYAGAKLGIGDYGASALEGFTRAANQVNVALKEDLGDEALTALSKITEVMGLIPKLGVEDAMLRTGSAIFKLANTSTATSGKIIDFSNRLLSLGKQGAMSTADILALGAAVDAMAVEPEVAATAFNKMIVEIRKGTSSLEKDLGIASGRLKQLVEDGKGMQAIQEIFQAMHGKENVFALENLFGDLGSEGGARMIRTMVTMADTVDILDKAVKNANTAFDEGTAITQEYNMQQQTAAAYMERASNLWEKTFINASNANGPIKEIAQSWFEMTENLVGAGEASGGFKLAIDALVFSVERFISLIPALVGGLMSKGVGAALIKLGPIFKATWDMALAGARSFIASLSVAATATGGFAAKWKAMDAAMKSNVIGLAVGIMAELVYWFSQCEKELTAVEKAQKAVDDIQKEARNQAQAQIVDTRALAAVARDENAALEDRRIAISKLNELVPEYNGFLDETTGKYAENKKALDEYLDSLVRSYEVEGAKVRLADLGGKKADAEIKRLKAQKELSLINEQPKTPSVYSPSAGVVFDTNALLEVKKAELRSVIADAQTDLDSYAKEESMLLNLYGDDIKKSVVVRPEGKKVGGASPTSGVSATPTSEDDARASISEFITKIRNYYERQINATIDDLTQRGIEKELQDQAVFQLQQRMNAALSAAKQSIVLGTDAWNEFKASMDDDLRERADEYGQSQSIVLKNATQRANVQQLRDDLLRQMPKFKKGEIVGLRSDERDRAYLDRLWLEASKSETKVSGIYQKFAEQRRKELLEHDYTGVVQQNSFIGLINTDFAYSDLTNLENDKNAVIGVLEKARQEIASVFETEGDREKLLKLLFGENYENMPMQFLGLLQESEDGIRLFYHKLIQYSDEYTAAEKKSADERKKIYEFLWKQKGMQASQDERTNALKQVNQGTERFREAGQGRGSSAPRSGLMGGSAFMEQFSYNGNIEQSKLEIELLQEKIKWMQMYGATSEQLAEQQAALAEKQDAYILALIQSMKERVDAVYELYKPIEDFGTAAGEAFATMTEDAEAGRDALKAAVGDMIKAMMKQTVQMTEEYIKRRMMQKINDKLVSTEIKKSTKEQTALEQQGADATSAIAEAAGQAKVLLTSKVGDEVTKAVTQQTQKTTATEQTAAVTDVQTEAAKTEANVGLGIASGAAKTIGSLGWWGIPLIAVITALLNGLLGFAMGKVSSLFGGGSKSADTSNAPNTKLVSGMLTYDQGNISRLIPMLDNGNVKDLHPYVDKDGSIYWAIEDKEKEHKGISLYDTPTATTINGQRALVAEKGPEIVIGRETTAAMSQDNPALLRALFKYDRHHSGRIAYDRGNVQQSFADTPSYNTADQVDTSTQVAIVTAINTLVARLNEPIEAKIDMYGHGKLFDSMNKANAFMKGKR